MGGSRMRKTVITTLFLGLIVVVLTGCTSSTPFDKATVTTYAGTYGILEQTSSADAIAAINTFSGRSTPSSYYISKDKSDAKYLYDYYVNKNNWYPKADIEELLVVTAREEIIGEAVYDSHVYLLYFEDKEKAKAYYDANAANVNSDRKNKTGYKSGYAYYITYSLSANRAGNCDWMRGIYLKGNSVIIIEGFSPIDGRPTFTDYIFGKLNLADPMTLK